jgi:hypothetical protein
LDTQLRRVLLLHGVLRRALLRLELRRLLLDHGHLPIEVLPVLRRALLLLLHALLLLGRGHAALLALLALTLIRPSSLWLLTTLATIVLRVHGDTVSYDEDK